MTTYTVTAFRGEAIRVFEIEATSPDEACMMVERDLAGEWDTDEITAEVA